jgi:hypothetical protein
MASWRRVLKETSPAKSNQRRRFTTAGQPGLAAAQLQRSGGGRRFWEAQAAGCLWWARALLAVVCQGAERRQLSIATSKPAPRT